MVGRTASPTSPLPTPSSATGMPPLWNPCTHPLISQAPCNFFTAEAQCLAHEASLCIDLFGMYIPACQVMHPFRMPLLPPSQKLR